MANIIFSYVLNKFSALKEEKLAARSAIVPILQAEEDERCNHFYYSHFFSFSKTTPNICPISKGRPLFEAFTNKTQPFFGMMVVKVFSIE